MRVLVIGAGGRTGRHIVEQALGHGHDVRAFVRSTEPGLAHPRLEVVRGDVLDFDAVNAAVEGCDAVAFALGSGGGSKVTVFSEGIANVIHAMAVHQIYKLAAISAAGTFARDDSRLSMGFRLKIKTTLKPVYDDLERMEQRIMASALDWTIVRPVGLSDGPKTGDYRTSLDGQLLPKSSRVSRADVAALVLKALETQVYTHSAVTIAD